MMPHGVLLVVASTTVDEPLDDDDVNDDDIDDAVQFGVHFEIRIRCQWLATHNAWH